MNACECSKSIVRIDESQIYVADKLYCASIVMIDSGVSSYPASFHSGLLLLSYFTFDSRERGIKCCVEEYLIW